MTDTNKKLSTFYDQNANPIPEDELVAGGWPAHFWENDAFALTQEKLAKVHAAKVAGHPDPWSATRD